MSLLLKTQLLDIIDLQYAGWENLESGSNERRMINLTRITGYQDYCVRWRRGIILNQIKQNQLSDLATLSRYDVL